MKLQALHLFIILIGSLIFCAACVKVREGMTSSGRSHTQYVGPAGDTVDVYSNNSGSATVGPRGNVLVNSGNDNYQGYDSSSTSATTYTGPAGNSATVVSSSNGVYASQIPPGDEDLYILKSQVVPPVCPACPTVSECPRQKPCSPCPPCARCPEPSFECKKVPNYSANDDQYLPRPVLADFSQFGM